MADIDICCVSIGYICPGTPATQNGSDSHEFQPWADSEATSPTLTAARKALFIQFSSAVFTVSPTFPALSVSAPSTAPVASDLKEPIVLRWDPPASGPQPPPQADSASPSASRERALEEEVRRLRDHISYISPAAAPAPDSAQSRERQLEEEVRRLREHISIISPPSYAGHGAE